MAQQTTSSQERQKRELQRQIGRTRDSLRDTVEKIQDTAEESTRQSRKPFPEYSITGTNFKKNQVVWSLGALSAGFALGYTLGYSHKMAKTKKGSQFANFADSVVDELSHVGHRLVLPELNAKITQLFGLDFAGLLQQMRGSKRTSKPKRLKKQRARKTAKRSRRGKASS